MGDHSPLSSFHRDIGIPINFQEESGLSPLRNNELRGPPEVSTDVRPPIQMRWDIDFSLGTAENIERKTNISVETRQGRMFSHLTSRSVCIILPNLV